MLGTQMRRERAGNEAYICGTEGFGDLGAFFGGEDDAAVGIVDGVGVVEFAGVLGEHLRRDR